ncbi:hypothetical protein ACFLZC_02745 [Patescibacteria group bacterium]
MSSGTNTKKESKSSLIAVFDIGSASIGGILFKKRKNFAPEIIASIRKSVHFSKKKKFSEMWHSTHNAFVEVSKYLQKNSKESPEQALCVFSSPWYTAQTKITKVVRDENFKVDEDLVKEIIQDNVEEFKREWGAKKHDKEEANVSLESAYTKALLNGYEVRDFFGKSAHNLELYTYLSLSMGFLKEKVQKEILGYIHSDKIYLHSFPFVLFNVLKNTIDTKEGALFIDISGEITDVLLIRNNIIEEVNSIPKGENFFIRRFASAFNIEPEDARARLQQYQRGELAKPYVQKAQIVIETAADEWGKHLVGLFGDISKDKFLPQNLYFSGPAMMVGLKEIKKQVSENDFAKFTIFNKPFNIRYLLPDSLKHHFDFKKGFSDNKDIFLLISVLFANNFLKNK